MGRAKNKQTNKKTKGSKQKDWLVQRPWGEETGLLRDRKVSLTRIGWLKEREEGEAIRKVVLW